VDLHIRDSNYFSEKYPERPNPYINWIWDRVLKHNEVTVFSDCHLSEALMNSSTIKIAYLIEPPVINSDMYEFIKRHYDVFRYIFTFDESFLSVSKKFVYFPNGTTWIGEADRKVYEKSKMTSIIASGKNWTEGHKLRHAAVERNGHMLSVMGQGYRAIPSKLEGLADYRYSVIIENSKINSYFTEKIEDCFFTGTVPIFWGCPKIGDFFDPNGIITFNTVEDLDIILNNISEAVRY
jgi:hypothetical protein